MAALAGDWGLISENDEECLQARKAFVEPLIDNAVANIARKSRKKEANVSEAGKKCNKPSNKKSSKKTGESSTLSKFDDPQVLGSTAWIEKELESVGLGRLVGRFESNHFPLGLLIYTEEHQLDSVLQVKNNKEAGLEPIELIKLQCLIKSMRVKVTQQTGPLERSNKISSSTSSSSSPSPHPVSSSPLPKPNLDGDVLLWDENTVSNWLISVPSLTSLMNYLKGHDVDGHRLLALTDRKLLQKYKMDNEKDRHLLLHHVGDLKALQITHASTHHTEIMNKILQGLSTELSHLKKTELQASSPVHSAPSSSSNMKRVPNYFLSLRIACPDLQERVRKIQNEIETAVPELHGSRSMLPPEQLHFTLGRLYLHSEADVALAKKLLEDCRKDIYKQLYTDGSQVAVNFRGVMNYGGNTVFLETERGNERDLLIEFGNTVYEHFHLAGLTSKEFRFQPVAPILRVRQSKKALTQRLQDASTTVLDPYADALLGRSVFSDLDISSVADHLEEDGYYKNLCSVPLNSL